MEEVQNEKQYLDSIFRGVSVDSTPIKDTFGKIFVAKQFTIPFEISDEQLEQILSQFNCSEENFFMGAYGLLLARFSGADEFFLAVITSKKIPVFMGFSPDQNINDYLKILSEQVEQSSKIITTTYEEIAETYDFPNAPEFISTPQGISGKSFALQVIDNSVTISFDGGKYSDALIKSFAAAYKHVVEKFLDAKKIGDRA